MASPIEYQSSHDDPDFVDRWLRCFAASTRTNKLKDDKEKGVENEIMDLVLVAAGFETILKVSTMSYPTNLED